jgi:hypothetical protein
VIRLRLDPQSIEKIPCFVVVIPFGDDDLPLNGLAGRLDAYLDGEAGRLITGGHLTGAWESQALLASRGRLAAEFVLFAGMGPMKNLAAREMSVRIEKAVHSAAKLSARSLAIHVPEGGPRGEYRNLAAETVNGALRGMADCTYDVDLIFSEPDSGRYEELTAAAERIVFRRVKGREVSVEVLV